MPLIRSNTTLPFKTPAILSVYCALIVRCFFTLYAIYLSIASLYSIIKNNPFEKYKLSFSVNQKFNKNYKVPGGIYGYRNIENIFIISQTQKIQPDSRKSCSYHNLPSRRGLNRLKRNSTRPSSCATKPLWN